MATRNIVPRADKEGQIGTTSKRWKRVLADDLQNARNSSDVTTTNLTATDITGLLLEIGANEVWEFEAYLKIGSSTAAGTKYAIDFPTAATVMAQVFGTLASATAFEVDTISADVTLGRVFNTAGITTAAQGAYIKIQGVIANGANAGNLQLQHAKVTSGTASVYANSFIRGRRIS